MDHRTTDQHDLRRFLDAQQGTYEVALSEIRQGQKRSHWMWFVFPQYAGLGLSPTSQRYAIKSIAEAEAYLGHPVLGRRLVECADALLRIEGRSARQIFDSSDDVKLKSSATLFAHVSPAGSVFERVLDKYFGGERDDKSLQLLSAPHDVPSVSKS